MTRLITLTAGNRIATSEIRSLSLQSTKNIRNLINQGNITKANEFMSAQSNIISSYPTQTTQISQSTDNKDTVAKNTEIADTSKEESIIEVDTVITDLKSLIANEEEFISSHNHQRVNSNKNTAQQQAETEIQPQQVIYTTIEDSSNLVANANTAQGILNATTVVMPSANVANKKNDSKVSIENTSEDHSAETSKIYNQNPFLNREDINEKFLLKNEKNKNSKKVEEEAQNLREMLKL